MTETAEHPRRQYQGRPTLLTPDLADRIVQVVSAGNYLKTAAQFAGVGQSTLMSWLARGRAAAAQVDAHNPDKLYCPGCDADRTAAVREEHDLNQAEEARYQAEQAAARKGEEPQPRAYAVLARCPACWSEDRPRPYQVPDDEVRYLDFLERVTQAETVAEVSAVTHWRRSFAEDWRAARDYLARKRPDQWAAKTTVSIGSEEAEARIERATLEALTALGVDGDGIELSGADDPGSVGDDSGPLDF